MAETLTVIGASVRAAVHSAVRAGFTPIAADLFADLDLARVTAVDRVHDYPQGLARVCAGSQPGGWMYTGGLENYPDLIRKLDDRSPATSRLEASPPATARPLWGNGADAIERVRDPALVAQVLRRAGLACPKLWNAAKARPGDGAWLRKPFRSTGGLRIARCQSEPTADLLNPDWYFQEFIPGLSCAAVYLAAGGEALFLGVSEQLIGTPWLGSGGFKYSGSIGPLELSARVYDQLVAVGKALAAGFDLIGLFGVDAVLADEIVWPVEVNPRYTASVEVLERGFGWAAIGAHVETCKTKRLCPAPGMLGRSSPIRKVCGKAVLFARQPLTIMDEQSRSWLQFADGPQNAREGPRYADVSAAGTVVPTDAPIVTLLASGEKVPQVHGKLQALAAVEESRLYNSSPPLGR